MGTYVRLEVSIPSFEQAQNFLPNRTDPPPPPLTTTKKEKKKKKKCVVDPLKSIMSCVCIGVGGC